MLHKHGNDDVNKDELSHENKDNEEDGCDDGRHAAVLHAVCFIITVFAQGILHYAIPVVTCCHSEQCKECHPKVAEVSVFSETLALMFFTAFCVK
jgi:hypothetical protein